MEPLTTGLAVYGAGMTLAFFGSAKASYSWHKKAVTAEGWWRESITWVASKDATIRDLERLNETFGAQVNSANAGRIATRALLAEAEADLAGTRAELAASRAENTRHRETIARRSRKARESALAGVAKRAKERHDVLVSLVPGGPPRPE